VRKIQFILKSKIIKTDENFGITLLDFIRDHKHLKGIKSSCREGDFEACTVLIETLNNKIVNYQNITSFISPLKNAHPLF